MRILLINQDWFGAELKAAGHEVYTISLFHGADFVLKVPLLHIDSILKEHLPDWAPELIIWHDNSAPVAVAGLEECDIPTIFYSVDAQHHVDVHRYSAHMFDYTFVAQKDYIPEFEETGIRPEWLPLWAPRYVEASSEKKHETVFVGNLDRKLNPDRVDFFEKLKTLVPIETLLGKYWEIFPFSEIVVNQSVKGDVNFRTFEAMMSGAVLLTEKAGNGLFDLFRDDEHLVTYEKGNVEEAARKIKSLLENPAKMREIALKGRNEILAKHTAAERAKQVLRIATSLKKKRNTYRYLGAMINYNVLSLALSHQNTFYERKAQLAALAAAERALEEKEPLLRFQSYHVAIACIRYDLATNSKSGSELVFRFADAYPEDLVLRCAKLRELLRLGRMEEATAYAKSISDQDVKFTFTKADQAITEILNIAESQSGIKVGENLP